MSSLDRTTGAKGCSGFTTAVLSRLNAEPAVVDVVVVDTAEPPAAAAAPAAVEALDEAADVEDNDDCDDTDDSDAAAVALSLASRSASRDALSLDIFRQWRP